MEAFRAEGWFCFKVHGSELTMAGLPDVIVCAEGYFIGVETKQPGREGNTSRRQEYVHTKIQQAGGIAFVASDVKSTVSRIHSILQELEEAGK